MIWLLETPAPVAEETLLPYLPLLDPERRERLGRYRFEKNRVEAILTGLLLRLAFAAEYGGALPKIALDGREKPFFPDRPELCFSLSHCDGAVCCALGGGAIGADVQTRVPYAEKYRRILSESERSWVEAADSDRRFTALWTRKEAYGKALGCGIAYPLAQTALAGISSTPSPYDGRLLWTLERGDLFLSVCAAQPLPLRLVTLAELLEALKTQTLEGLTMFDAVKMKDACVQWIRDFFAENGPDCNAVLGISGGKDSSVAAALCSEALGKERVIGVLMPNGIQHDIDMAYLLCDHLGIRRYEVNIRDAVEGVKNAIPAELELSQQSLTNLPPRIRMSTLYAVSQSCNGRVVNTCNLSEDWVGYSTRYGDAAGDFSPMSHLTVQEVKAIGRVLGLPEVLVDKVPIDGLCGKTDEDNLGFSYAVLDRYIRTGEIDDPKTKERIDTLHRRNLFKLKLMPGFENALPVLAD